MAFAVFGMRQEPQGEAHSAVVVQHGNESVAIAAHVEDGDRPAALDDHLIGVREHATEGREMGERMPLNESLPDGQSPVGVGKAPRPLAEG